MTNTEQHGQSGYLGQTFLEFALRPVRFAYLFRSDSMQAALDAIEESSSRWGGATELLLPFSADGEVDPRLLVATHLVPPDHYTFAGEVPDNEIRAKLEEQIDARIVPLPTIQHEPAGGLHQLAVAPTPPPRSSVALWAAETSAPVVRQAACGTVSAESAKAWSDRQQSLVRYVHDTAKLGMVQVTRSTVLDGTLEQLRELPGSEWRNSPALVWVSAEDSFQDAVAFWNRRAMIFAGEQRPPACAVTPEVLNDSEFLEELERTLRNRWEQVEPDIVVGSATIGPRRLEGLVRRAGWEVYRDKKVQFTYHAAGIPEPHAPRKATVRMDFLQLQLRKRSVGQVVRPLIQLDRTATWVVSDSPVRFSTPFMAGNVRARFSGADEFSLPPGSSLGGFFHPNATTSGGVVEIETGVQARYEFKLAIPTRANLLASSVDDSGMSLSPSDKGQLAQGVLARLPDLEVLRKPQVLDCIEALTTHRVAYDVVQLRDQFPDAHDQDLEDIARRLQNVRQISRSLSDIASRLHVSPRSAAPAVEDLVASGLVFRGLQAHCDTCGIPSFMELRDVQQTITWPGCGSLAKAEVDRNRGEAELHYRLNSLVDRASDNGVLVHLLAVAGLRRRDPKAHIQPGVNLEGGGDGLRELDLLALIGNEIWFGEAKTSPQRFTSEQIDRDVRLAAQVKARHYLMTCLDSIHGEIKGHASEICIQEGIKLWVLEAQDGELVEIRPSLGTGRRRRR